MRTSTGLYAELYALAQKVKLPMTQAHVNDRKDFHQHRRSTFGIVIRRIGRARALSSISSKYPKFYTALVEYGRIICPHPFTSIHVVHNLTCSPHKDRNNVGPSTVVAFGAYEGGRLMIRDLVNSASILEHDTFQSPITFNGALQEHWNTNDLVGDKYSLVYFTVKDADPNDVIYPYSSSIFEPHESREL